MTERQIKDKYTLVGVTVDNLDQKIKQVVDGIKRDIRDQGCGNLKINTIVTKMSYKESQLYIDVTVSIEE